MFHTIVIVGNLGKVPELRYAPSGDPVCSLSVAANRQYTDSSGEKVKETTWFKVSVWGKQAEAADKYLKKGSQVLIHGELKPDKNTGNPRTFTYSDGTVGASYEVRARTIRFLDRKSESAEPVQHDQEEQIPF